MLSMRLPRSRRHSRYLLTTVPQVSTKLKRRILIMDKKKTLVSIIVKDGLVQEVFSEDPAIDIEIIDMDSADALELEYDQAVAMLRKTAEKIY
jgi:hypothetical protein